MERLHQDEKKDVFFTQAEKKHKAPIRWDENSESCLEMGS